MNSLKSILLVEDDEDDQIFFVSALSELKNATLFDLANNGKAALERLSNTVVMPDLIFTDFQMPQMNGIEFLREIAKNPKWNNIPVIMLSGSNDLREQALNLGAKAFITKPNTIGKLRDELKKAIQISTPA